MKKIIQILIVVLIVTLFAGTLVFLYQKSRKKPVVIRTDRPFYTDIQKKTVVTGTIVPRKEIEIKPQIIGIIEKIYVQEGDIVQKGDIIARIKVTPKLTTLNNAETRLEQAVNTLEDAMISFERQRRYISDSLVKGKLNRASDNPALIALNTAIYRVEKSGMTLENAEEEFRSQKLLLEKSIVSEEKFRLTELALNKAKTDLIEAKENLSLIETQTIKTIEQEFQKASLGLKKAETEYQAAVNNLKLIREGETEANEAEANTLIRSTIGGMVLAISVKEGNLVIESSVSSIGTTVATVADMTDMIFEGTIDESEVGKIKEGMDLVLSIGAVETDRFLASIEHISPKGAKVNGTVQFSIRASVQLKRALFVRAGYSATADIVLDKRANALAVKERWLSFDQGKPFVTVQTSSGEVVKTAVELGLSDGLNIEVVRGVSEDTVIQIPR